MTARPVRGAGPETLVRGRLPATDAAVSAVLARLGRALAERGVAEAARSDVVLALGEILNNIVEHSVAGLADPRLALEVTHEGDRIHVETTDNGRPLPPSLLASAALPALPDDPGDIDAFPEGGFGWFIVHNIAQDMTYERTASVNRLAFHFDC